MAKQALSIYLDPAIITALTRRYPGVAGSQAARWAIEAGLEQSELKASLEDLKIRSKKIETMMRANIFMLSEYLTGGDMRKADELRGLHVTRASKKTLK